MKMAVGIEGDWGLDVLILFEFGKGAIRRGVLHHSRSWDVSLAASEDLERSAISDVWNTRYLSYVGPSSNFYSLCYNLFHII